MAIHDYMDTCYSDSILFTWALTTPSTWEIWYNWNNKAWRWIYFLCDFAAINRTNLVWQLGSSRCCYPYGPTLDSYQSTSVGIVSRNGWVLWTRAWVRPHLCQHKQVLRGSLSSVSFCIPTLPFCDWLSAHVSSKIGLMTQYYQIWVYEHKHLS